MEQIIKLILLAYRLEGIWPRDVAIITSRGAGLDVFQCMAPQQHNAARAGGIKSRVAALLVDYPADVIIRPTNIITASGSERMHQVVVELVP